VLRGLPSASPRGGSRGMDGRAGTSSSSDGEEPPPNEQQRAESEETAVYNSSVSAAQVSGLHG
jgi:hypothetical protein